MQLQLLQIDIKRSTKTYAAAVTADRYQEVN